MADKFTGRVSKGRREGTKLGFPTANIKVTKNIHPGIYAGYTSVFQNKLHDLPSIFYVAENTQTIEAHILDFPAQDLYGQELSVKIIHKLRDVQEFPNLEIAKEQIKRDELKAREWFLAK